MRFVKQRYEVIPIDAVRPHPDNANEGDVGAVYHSQGVNGFYGVIYAQESSGRILAGHTRYYAARHHGAEEIPCIWLDVDDATALRIVLVDNKARDLASYDDNALEALLGKVWDMSGTLEGTGFDGTDFDELRAQLDKPPHSYQSEGAGKGEAPRGQEGTETGQGGPPEPEEGEDTGEGAARGLKRLGFNMLRPADHETIMSALAAALEAGGGKLASLKRRAAQEGEEYNPATLGLLAVCVHYLESKGVGVGDEQK